MRKKKSEKKYRSKREMTAEDLRLNLHHRSIRLLWTAPPTSRARRTVNAETVDVGAPSVPDHEYL
jgi:phosphoenolpyruvate carboxylase